MCWVQEFYQGVLCKIIICPLLLSLLFVARVNAQRSDQSFTSVNLPGNAQLSALGGINVSLVDQNVNFFQSNPALNSDSSGGWASANHLFFFAGIGLSTFSYQHQFSRLGSMSFGFQHLSLGNIDGYDVTGNATQNYNSGESAIFLSKSHQVNNFSFGVTTKGFFSNLAGFRASAMLFDIGGAFIHPSKELSIGLVMKNFGFVMSEYSASSATNLPFDVQLGVSYKPDHMPLRFSLTSYNLVNFNKASVDTLINKTEPSTIDQIAQHFVIGTEVLLHRNVTVMLGYNFLKHSELKLEQAGGGSGLSIGAKAHVKNVSLSFSRSGYVTGGAWHVSLDMNANKIFKKRKI